MVGIVTRLRARRSEVRIPVGVRDLSSSYTTATVLLYYSPPISISVFSWNKARGTSN